MRLFRRIGDIIAANLNELVDQFDNPEVMLKQAIREMQTMIDDATAGAARAIAGERLLGRELSDHQEQTRRWQTRAEEAVNAGDDERGRLALSRKLEHEAIAVALADHNSTAERTAQALRAQIGAMRAKHAEARRKLASLSARRQMVEAGRAFRVSSASSARATGGFARFEQMSQQIDLAEAEAQAIAELYESPESLWQSEAGDREQSHRVEAELAAIKAKIQTAQPQP